MFVDLLREGASDEMCHLYLLYLSNALDLEFHMVISRYGRQAIALNNQKNRLRIGLNRVSGSRIGFNTIKS